MAISLEAQRVRDALVKKGLETPYFDTGKTPEEKKELIAAKMKEVMEIIGLDVNDDSLHDTPKRIAKMYINEIFSGLDYSNFPSITLIENKTNYDEYLLTEKSEDELVLYHGGFLSPQKKKFYKKLSLAVHVDIEISFWADIDLGGFKMFEKLQAIFPGLSPMRMSAEDVAKYHVSGKVRGADYLAQLRDCLREKKYPLFSETITQILTYGVTIEQEVFLEEKKKPATHAETV